jgi:hypothetical protein
VKRRLKQAEQLLKKHDEKGFHAELSRALLGYLGDRLNLDTHALTREQLRPRSPSARWPRRRSTRCSASSIAARSRASRRRGRGARAAEAVRRRARRHGGI